MLYTTLLLGGKLNSHIAQIDQQAAARFDLLMKQIAEREGITEGFKEHNQMVWVGRINNIRNRAEEIVNAEIIFS